MGNSSSSTADANGASDCTDPKLLGDEILCGIISAQQGLATNLKSKSSTERAALKKQISETTVLQQKFQDYRKLVEEVKDQNIEQLNSDLLKLKLDLKSSKQEIIKITMENQALEILSAKEIQDRNKAISELNGKLQNEIKLKQEVEAKLKLSEQKAIRDLTFLKEKLNSECFKLKHDLKNSKQEIIKITTEKQDLKNLSAKDVQDLNKTISELNKKLNLTESRPTSEVDSLNFKLQNETKFKQELENKLNLGKQNAILFEEKIRKQTKLIFDMQERLNITQKELDSEIGAKREMSYRFELELGKLKQERENLARDYLLQSTESDSEHSKIKITVKKQADQLKILNRTLKMKENELQQQKTSKKKVQEELRAVLHTEEKQVKDLYETLCHVSRVDEKLKHFEAKTYKQTTNYNIKTENSKTDEENFKESESERKQVKELYETLCKLNVTQGKLFLLEENFKNIKKFFTKELRERKDFFKNFEEHRQQSKIYSGKLLTATKKEKDYFLKEKMNLERQLDQKTKEIALLKQHLKQKEMELQNAAYAERSSSKRDELNQLHEEFLNSLKQFDQN